MILLNFSNCLSEVSFSFSHEESRENSCSFTSRQALRSFSRTTCKKCPAFVKLRLGKQEDRNKSLRVISQQHQTKQSIMLDKSLMLQEKKEMIATSPAFLAMTERG